MNWGNKIIVVLTLFVTGIGYMVYICMKQKDIELVSYDYYEQEIKYQQTIDKEANYNALIQKPLMTENDSCLLLDFSKIENHQEITGKIGFFRPSKSSLDFQIPIELDDLGNQTINTKQMIQGKWIMKLDWSDKSRNYYCEKVMWI